MNPRRFFAAALVVALLLALTGTGALAESTTFDFEDFSPGNIHGQQGWSRTGSYDHVIVENNADAPAVFGTKSLRMSNAVVSGAFGDQTFTKLLVDEAGETTAYEPAPSGTRRPVFVAEWSFASTTPNDYQPGLSVVASPDAGDGGRMSWVQMTDTPTGLQVNFNDYQDAEPYGSAASPSDGGGDEDNFILTTVAGELDRTVPHTIRIEMELIDGPRNDVVRILVDGILRHTGTSWEDYFRWVQGPGLPEPTAPVFESRVVRGLLFRTGGTAGTNDAPASLGKGFLIDNLSIATGEVPELEIEDDEIDMFGVSTFGVPVKLETGHLDTSALGFTVAWDKPCVAFDAVTDSNNDKIPDAVASSLPSGFVLTVEESTSQSVKLLVKPVQAQPPLPVLPSGELLALTFSAQACGNVTGTPVEVNFSFPPAADGSVPSFGSRGGYAIYGTTDPGMVELTFNAKPTGITLAPSPSTVDENQAAGAPVGTLCTDDPDGTDCVTPATATFIYALACTTPGAGDYAFQVVGSELKTKIALDHEVQDSYSVCVRSTDAYGLFHEETFTVAVDDLNEAPEDIGLEDGNNDGVYTTPENQAGFEIGKLSTSDPDAGDTHTYVFCPGSPSPNPFTFTFAGADTKLATAFALNYEVAISHNVCLISTDQGGETVQRTFTISVDDVNDAPVAYDDPASPPLIVVGDDTPVILDVLANDTDQDAGQSLTIDSFVQAAGEGTVTNNGTNLSYKALQNFNGVDTFTYVAKDNGSPALTSNAATVTVNVVAKRDRGDCNADGRIDAADFPATVLEIFDIDQDAPAWWKIYTGSFPGSPLGCDSDASQNGPDPAHPQPSVGAEDIICTVLVFFGNDACTEPLAMVAAVAAPASLTIPADVNGVGGATVAVPVMLKTAGHAVAAATFALTYDPAVTALDMTDADRDGVPDAISLNVPAGMAKTVSVDPAAGRIQVAVYATALPMPLLSDGTLATISLQVNGTSALALGAVSMGSDQGQRVPTVNDISTEPTEGGATRSLFLPFLNR